MIRRNALMASVSNGLKFIVSAVMVIILARMFGPEKFGIFAFAKTAGMFLAVIVDYGFNIQAVREISKSPESVTQEAQRMMAAKIFLTLLTLLGCLVFFGTSSRETAVLVLIMTVYAIFISFGQYFFSVLRAFNRFSEETRSAIISNIILFVPLVVLLAMDADIYLVSIVFALSGLAYFLLGIKVCAGDFHLSIRKGLLDFKEMYGVLKIGFPYALLISTNLLFVSIDTFIVNHVLGSEAVGIYQSGIRFIFATAVLTETLMAVYLPVLTQGAVRDNAAFVQRAKQMIRVSMIISLPIAVTLVILPDQVTALALGGAYSQTAEILPYFGFVIILRFMTVALGTMLTAKGLHKKRTLAILTSLTVLIAGAYILIYRNGIVGVAIASLLAHLVLLGMHSKDMYSADRELYLERKTVYMVVLSAAVFVFAFLIRPGLPLGLVMIALVSAFCLTVGLTRLERKALLRTDWLSGKKQPAVKN